MDVLIDLTVAVTIYFSLDICLNRLSIHVCILRNEDNGQFFLRVGTKF